VAGLLLLMLAGGGPGAAAQSAAQAGAREAGTEPRPGDFVRLRIWREPELSGEFQVNEDGTVVLPRLGPRQVGDRSPSVLRVELVAAYSRILNHSSIEVTVLRRVQVLGAVGNPGLYPVDPTMTVSDILAVAGGTTPLADARRIVLMRDGQRLPIALTPAARIDEAAIRSGDQIFVPERSWMSRNSATVVSSAIAAAAIFVAALLR
jgi:polysaccharide export outer membrane protein